MLGRDTGTGPRKIGSIPMVSHNTEKFTVSAHAINPSSFPKNQMLQNQRNRYADDKTVADDGP